MTYRRLLCNVNEHKASVGEEVMYWDIYIRKLICLQRHPRRDFQRVSAQKNSLGRRYGQ